MPEQRARVLRSVGTRLALATATLVLLVATGLYFALQRHQERGLLEAKSNEAMGVAALFAELSSAPVLFNDEQGVRDSVGYLRTNPEVEEAAVFARAPDGHIGPALASLVTRQTGVARLRAPAASEVGRLKRSAQALDVSQWVRDPSGQPIAVVAVRFSLARENRSSALLARRTQQVAIATALVLLVLLLLLARIYIISPLRALHAAMRALSSGTSHHVASKRLPLTTQNEVGDLARGFVGMADAIARREAAIARQNAEMRLVLDNVGQGFLVLDPRGVIEGQHSAVVERWFGPVRPGATLWDYLREHDPEQAEWLELAWSNIGASFMPLELCVEQMPKSCAADGRHYELEYRPILAANDALANMVVVISDVSELRRREEAEREQRELVALFGALVRDRAGFVGFCEDAEAELAALARPDPSATRERLEQLHTLKGNAWVFQLRSLAQACEEVESACSAAQRAPSPDEVARLSRTLASELEPVRPFLGREDEHAVQLSGDDLRSIEQALRGGEPGERVLARLTQASAEPAEQVLARFAARVEVLARRLGKAPVEVDVQGAGLRFPRRNFASLWASLVHALRNIADHGIETSWERERSGKPRTANVRLRASVEGGQLRLELRDDGRGVDWERVRARAAERGLPHATRAELAEALLHHGFSTRDGVSELSGRGVGLAALANEVKRLGGELQIESEPGQGTALRIALPAHLLAA